MPLPMCPNPTNPTFMTIVLSSCAAGSENQLAPIRPSQTRRCVSPELHAGARSAVGSIATTFRRLRSKTFLTIMAASLVPAEMAKARGFEFGLRTAPRLSPSRFADADGREWLRNVPS